jgi:uncharacterized protein
MGIRFRQMVRVLLALVFCASFAYALQMPERPNARVNDYASVLSPSEVSSMEQKLSQFEKETSNQVVVAIFPSLDGEDVDDFTNRLFEKWHLGQKDRNNGVLLTVFVQDHKVRIEVGYGLEAVLTDAISSQIIRDEIAPEFREQHYAAGLNAAIDSIEKATRGEYKAKPQPPQQPFSYGTIVILILFVILWMWLSARRRRSGMYLPGRGYSGCGPMILFPGGGGGWGSGGGGGGFSGGGGLSGGGGESGSW